MDSSPRRTKGSPHESCALVTPSGTKIAHLASDLAALENVPPEPLARVLETLAAERILRPVAPPPGRSSLAMRSSTTSSRRRFSTGAPATCVREQERLRQAERETPRGEAPREALSEERAASFRQHFSRHSLLVSLVLGFAWHREARRRQRARALPVASRRGGGDSTARRAARR